MLEGAFSEELQGMVTTYHTRSIIISTVIVFCCTLLISGPVVQETLAKGNDIIRAEMTATGCHLNMSLDYGLSSSGEAMKDMSELRDVFQKFPEDLKSELTKQLESALREKYVASGRESWELEIDDLELDMSMSGEEARIDLSFKLEGIVYKEDSQTVFNLSWRAFQIKKNFIAQNVVVDPDLFGFILGDFGVTLEDWDRTVEGGSTVLSRVADLELYPSTIVATSFTFVIPFVEDVTVEADIVTVEEETATLGPLAIIRQNWMPLSVVSVIAVAILLYLLIGRDRIEDFIDRVS